MSKIISEKQAQQFNNILGALARIAKDYETPRQIKKDSKYDWGLAYEEALEMSYENIQEEAKAAIKNVKRIL